MLLGRAPKSQRSHLVAQELIQVSELLGVSDLAVQGGVPLCGPRGPADPDGGVPVDPAAALARHAVGMRGIRGQGGCKQAGENVCVY